MDTTDIKKASKGILATEIATRSSDPNFFGGLMYLPNPDTVLRKLGKSSEVFDAIVSDAHVIGELRAVRAGLLGWEWRIAAGGEEAADMRALELCETVFGRRPAPGHRWPDLIWNIAQAVFRGFRVHEIVWGREGSVLLPVKILDRPDRRFVFSEDNELRLLTRQDPMKGVELGAYKWLLARHMPSFDNPYGVALFSSCFWPYTFKHSGWRYFMKFCEKYGLPWAVGKYPEGTPKQDQDALADALAAMIEDAVAAIPAGGSVELLENKGGGVALPQERLIKMCNSEMSKAITSQTLATEIQGEGSRAASETHRGREEDVNASDRTIIADALTELCTWITELNVPGAKSPRFEFFEEAAPRKDWVEVLDKARRFVPVPTTFARERLQIPAVQDGEEVLPGFGQAEPTGQVPAEFSRCRHCGGHHDFAAGADPITTGANQGAALADAMLESLIDQVRSLADKATTIEEFQAGLAKIYPEWDATKLGEMTAAALMAGQLQGVAEASEHG